MAWLLARVPVASSVVVDAAGIVSMLVECRRHNVYESYLSGRVAYTVVDVGLDAGAAVRTDAIIVITLFIKAFSH